MSGFPNSPRLLHGGIVLIDPATGRVLRVIALQYNPDTLTRTLQPQSLGGESHERSQALRLAGPAIETFRLDAELDATDQLEFPDRNAVAVRVGIGPQLAALETILYPPSSQLIANNAIQSSGTLEIAPLLSPLTLFVWSSQRVVPVRITDINVTEEAFDALLNPTRAKVSLSMRVLSTDDLGFDTKGGSLYLIYQQNREKLAQAATAGSLPALGLTGIP